jgi:hypothetical protein
MERLCGVIIGNHHSSSNINDNDILVVKVVVAVMKDIGGKPMIYLGKMWKRKGVKYGEWRMDAGDDYCHTPLLLFLASPQCDKYVLK